MTNLTEAEKAHGWVLVTYQHAPNPRPEWMSTIFVSEHAGVWVDEYSGNDADALILALLQAKGIHRRMVAEMTNTTHEGEL